MTSRQASSQNFDRLVRQLLHEVHEYGPSRRRRLAGLMTADDALAVPVFDRGPARAAPADARGRQ